MNKTTDKMLHYNSLQVLICNYIYLRNVYLVLTFIFTSYDVWKFKGKMSDTHLVGWG